VVDESWLLLANDLVVGTRWMDLRKVQDPTRNLGAAPTAAWQAFRKIVPFESAPGTPPQPAGPAALEFMTATPASTFYPGGPPMPKPAY